MTTERIALIGALLLAGCTTQGQESYLVITKVVEGTQTPATATSPATCTVDAGAKQVDFLHVNPAESSGAASPVVDNRFPSSAISGEGRLNSYDFIAHQAVIDYEVIGKGTLPRQIVPVDGTVLGGSSAPVSVPFFAAGSNALLTNGQAVRVYFHIEGKTLDGATARTNQAEYLFIICTAAGCTSPCL